MGRDKVDIERNKKRLRGTCFLKYCAKELLLKLAESGATRLIRRGRLGERSWCRLRHSSEQAHRSISRPRLAVKALSGAALTFFLDSFPLSLISFFTQTVRVSTSRRSEAVTVLELGSLSNHSEGHRLEVLKGDALDVRSDPVGEDVPFAWGLGTRVLVVALGSSDPHELRHEGIELLRV